MERHKLVPVCWPIYIYSVGIQFGEIYQNASFMELNRPFTFISWHRPKYLTLQQLWWRFSMLMYGGARVNGRKKIIYEYSKMSFLSILTCHIGHHRPLNSNNVFLGSGKGVQITSLHKNRQQNIQIFSAVFPEKRAYVWYMADYQYTLNDKWSGIQVHVCYNNLLLLCIIFMVNTAPFEWKLPPREQRT